MSYEMGTIKKEYLNPQNYIQGSSCAKVSNYLK